MLNLINLKRTAGISLGAAVLATAIGAAPANALTCAGSHHYVQGVAAHYDQGTAMAMARKSWTKKVRDKYSLEWSVWEIAKGKQQACSPGANNMKYCFAKAKPCKTVIK